MTTDVFLVCPACKAESPHALQIEHGQLLSPLVTVRLRTRTGERNVQHLPATCPSCGLVSYYDAETILREATGREETQDALRREVKRYEGDLRELADD